VTFGELVIPDGDIEDEDIDISGGWDGTSCLGIEYLFEGLLVRLITDQINEMAGPMITENLCRKCEAGQGCPQLSTCDGEVCQEQSGTGCVFAGGTEGRMDLGAMLASFQPGLTALMDLHTWLGSYARTNDGGLSLGLLAGAESAAHHPCVPQRTPPPIPTLTPSTAFQGNLRPDGQPFHLGIGVHRSFLDVVGYSVFDSGLLCLEVGAAQTSFLTVGTFGILIESLFELTHDEDVPVLMSLRPQNPLTFTISDQSLVQDPESGEYTLESPLLTVSSADFAVDVYLQMDYRYVRAFRLHADLALGLGLTANGAGQLVPVLGDLRDGFRNFSVTDSELLAEDPATLASLFPALIDMAASQLGGAIPPIDLPSALGFSLLLDEGSFAAVDGGELLGIFANLAYTAPQPKAGARPVHTRAELTPAVIGDPERLRLRALADYDRGPEVTLRLGGDAPAADLEWQVRVNGGIWSPFSDAPVRRIRRPAFFLQGRHALEVRGRVKGQPATLDPEPVALTLTVDGEPPRLAVERLGDQLVVTASDFVTPAAELEVAYRLDSGAWGPWRRGVSTLALPAGFAGTAEIRVRDTAGHVTTVALRSGAVASVLASGCATGGSAQGGLLVVLILGLLAVRRRRRALLAAAATGAVLAALSGCGGNAGQGGSCGDAGPPPLVCTNADLTCPAGQSLAGTTPPQYDRACQPVPVPCQCVTTVTPGDYGRFLSLAARDGRVMISSYSDRYGDLVVTRVGAGGALTPEAVDGIPDGPVVGDPAGYRGGISKSGTDVGQFTSAALDGQGTLHVSYADLKNGTLKVARGEPGAWTTHEVETYTEDRARVSHTAMVLLPGDVPGVAYQVTGLADPADPDVRVGQLRFARASTPAPAGPADWTITVVDESLVSCAESCLEGRACTDASPLHCLPETTGCASCAEGEVCVDVDGTPTCSAVLEIPTYVDHPEGVGLYVTAALRLSEQVVLAYHDRTGSRVRLAVGDGTTWQTLTVDEEPGGYLGLYTTLAVGLGDVLHLAYADAARDQLVYAEVDAGNTLLLREVVDDGLRDDGPHRVGLDAKLYLHDTGFPVILHQDGTTADLLQNVRAQPGLWSRTVLRSGATGEGFFVDVARDSDGTRWIAQYVYDRSTPALTRLEVWTLP
jgi:MYXO-CTERM domain-containing protein